MFRPALVVLLVVLPPTLGLRLADPGKRIPNQERLVADAVQALADDGWSVRPPERQIIGRLVEGSRGDCRILVHLASPDGQSDEKFRILARSIGPVTYQYRGALSSELPRFSPMLAEHFQRYAWSYGLDIPTAPLVAIALSPACSSQTPDFTGLRQHLQVARKTA